LYSTSRETTIPATPPKLFELIGDLERRTKWSGNCEVGAVRKITEGPVRVGTCFEADEDFTEPKVMKTSSLPNLKSPPPRRGGLRRGLG
jgi:hypothetical protein